MHKKFNIIKLIKRNIFIYFLNLKILSKFNINEFQPRIKVERLKT